jgi:hypothetical protein
VQVGQHEIMYIDERTPRVRSASDPGDTAAGGGDAENSRLS